MLCPRHDDASSSCTITTRCGEARAACAGLAMLIPVIEAADNWADIFFNANLFFAPRIQSYAIEDDRVIMPIKQIDRLNL